MPGFIIHIAVAKEYMRKHKNEIINQNNFIEGIMAPDFSKNKYESHYHNHGNRCEGLNYLLDNADFDINSDYGKGYFLHILTDYIFYEHTFKKEEYDAKKIGEKFYSDYDRTNKFIIEKYNIYDIPERIKKYSNFVDEKPQFLKIEKLIDFIDFVSKSKIEDQITKIKETGEPIIKEVRI